MSQENKFGILTLVLAISVVENEIVRLVFLVVGSILFLLPKFKKE